MKNTNKKNIPEAQPLEGVKTAEGHIIPHGKKRIDFTLEDWREVALECEAICSHQSISIIELYEKLESKANAQFATDAGGGKDSDPDYKPIYCDHKKQSGKYAGFSNFELLSHSSGGGGEEHHEVNMSVCRGCGEVKIQGWRSNGNHRDQFSETFSIHYPDAVADIVKNCNYMNAETEGYVPFIKAAPSTHSSSEMVEVEKVVELLEQYSNRIQSKSGLNEFKKLLLKINEK